MLLQIRFKDDGTELHARWLLAEPFIRFFQRPLARELLQEPLLPLEPNYIWIKETHEKPPGVRLYLHD